MRILVQCEAFESLVGAEAVADLREIAGRQINKLNESGKLELGWVLGDARAPQFIVNVDSSAELHALLGGAIMDRFKVQTHPIVTFEELARLFEDEAKKP